MTIKDGKLVIDPKLGRPLDSYSPEAREFIRKVTLIAIEQLALFKELEAEGYRIFAGPDAGHSVPNLMSSRLSQTEQFLSCLILARKEDLRLGSIEMIVERRHFPTALAHAGNVFVVRPDEDMPNDQPDHKYPLVELVVFPESLIDTL